MVDKVLTFLHVVAFAVGEQSVNRIVLPKSCTSYLSKNGQEMFQRANVKGHAEAFPTLMSQFQTQDHPNSCSVSTMTIVLNALELDPGRIWDGIYRWYDEPLLDIIPNYTMDDVHREGMTLEQLACVARCSKVDVKVFGAYDDATDLTLEQFREAVISAVSKANLTLVVNFNRKLLGQYGFGHISPVVAYDEELDQALIADTARFKYPPYWVKLTDLVEAMRSVDSSSGKSRGYMLVSKKPSTAQLRVFSLGGSFLTCKPEAVEAIPRLNHIEDNKKSFEDMLTQIPRDDQDQLDLDRFVIFKIPVDSFSVKDVKAGLSPKQFFQDTPPSDRVFLQLAVAELSETPAWKVAEEIMDVKDGRRLAQAVFLFYALPTGIDEIEAKRHDTFVLLKSDLSNVQGLAVDETALEICS